MENAKIIGTTVKEIIINVLNLEIEVGELLEENLIEAYGINSVDALEILLHIENEFMIQIDEEDLNAELITSIQKLSNYLEKKLACNILKAE